MSKDCKKCAEDYCDCQPIVFGCPNFIEAGLRLLAFEIERVEWNLKQIPYEAPTANNGLTYGTGFFTMRAYDWGDDEDISDKPNFECEGFEVRWYKYLGRGMNMNKNIDANDFFVIIDKCLKSVRALEGSPESEG